MNEALLRKTRHQLTLAKGIRKLKLFTFCDQFGKLIGDILDLTPDFLFGPIRAQRDYYSVFGVLGSSVRVSEIAHDLIRVEAAPGTATEPRSGEDCQVEILPVRPIDNRCLVGESKKRLPTMSTCDGVLLQSKPPSTIQEIGSWLGERETLGSIKSTRSPALGSCRAPMSYEMISTSVPNRTSREFTSVPSGHRTKLPTTVFPMGLQFDELSDTEGAVSGPERTAEVSQ
jgi:hypothetical protein